MKLLLDTHVFLWFISGDPRIPAAFRAVIQDLDNDVYLSVASVWEAIIKYKLGKLPLPEPPEIYLPRRREGHLIKSLVFDETTLIHLANLPPLHRDPFDRIIIAQSLQHDMTVATVDDDVRAYPIKLLSKS